MFLISSQAPPRWWEAQFTNPGLPGACSLCWARRRRRAGSRGFGQAPTGRARLYPSPATSSPAGWRAGGCWGRAGGTARPGGWMFGEPPHTPTCAAQTKPRAAAGGEWGEEEVRNSPKVRGAALGERNGVGKPLRTLQARPSWEHTRAKAGLGQVLPQFPQSAVSAPGHRVLPAAPAGVSQQHRAAPA